MFEVICNNNVKLKERSRLATILSYLIKNVSTFQISKKHVLQRFRFRESPKRSVAPKLGVEVQEKSTQREREMRRKREEEGKEYLSLPLTLISSFSETRISERSQDM
jgi:hypothetical protein